MSAGTLTLTNNSDLVSGAGTSFSTELTAGDFVVVTVGGVTYTLPVKSVEGDTEITLISKYPGPTQQDSAWNAVPRATQNQVTAALVVQSTEALRGLNYDKQNWQAVFSADGNITVFLPDGTSFSGPSWKSIAETLSTLDVDYLNQLAAQINHDAQQVETDKNTVVDTAQQVSTDAQTASTAATGAQGSAAEAAQSETNAEDYKELARKYALNPEDSPVTGNEYSSFHYSEKSRKSAEEAASHNPVEALVKSLNLSDLADRAAAWLNVRPIGSTPLAGDPVNPYDATTQRWVVNYVSGGGGVGPTMNGVQNYGVGESVLVETRAFIRPSLLPKDGQLLNRADWPELWAWAQMTTPISDAMWLATPGQRGKYSLGDGSTTFRMPDWNGVQPNSIPGLFARGDQGGALPPGNVYESAAPNISGGFSGAGTIGGGWIAPPNGSATGAFGLGADGSLARIINSAVSAVTGPSNINFDASRSNPVYGRSSNQIWPNSVIGVWCARASGGFVAANTSWSVNNEDAEMPPSGTWANGGIIRSAYRVAGVDVSASAMYTSFAIDSGGYRNAKLNLSVDNKNGANYTLSISEKGVINSSNGEFNFDSLIRSSAHVVCGAGNGFVVPASEVSANNEIRILNPPTGSAIPTGAFCNSMYGRWYNALWQLGGVRSASTALQRVQLNVSDGVGANASYMFNPNGTAQAAQWQNTSDRRVKSCIETIPDPLAVMRSMRGYSWYYEPYGTQGFGFMADEAEKYFPGAVKTTEDFEVEMPDGSKIGDVKSVDTYGIAAALHHEAILKMMDKIEALEAEIKKLKGE